MKDEYTYVFYNIIRETSDVHGYYLPEHLESYVVMLLSSYVEKPDFLPKTSFAEQYLTNKNLYTAKELGDTCLFVTGVFPAYGKNKGLDIDYFSNIGKSSYSSIQQVLNVELFTELSLRFDYIRDFIKVSLKNQNKINLLNILN